MRHRPYEEPLREVRPHPDDLHRPHWDRPPEPALTAHGVSRHAGVRSARRAPAATMTEQKRHRGDDGARQHL